MRWDFHGYNLTILKVTLCNLKFHGLLIASAQIANLESFLSSNLWFFGYKVSTAKNDKCNIPKSVTYVEEVPDLLLDKLNNWTFNILCNSLYCNIHITILKRLHIH